MTSDSILLIEDNPDDEELTLLALGENEIRHDVAVARDGEEALAYLFGTGKYRDRDISVLPVVVLLDLNLPRISGLEILRRLRSDERTRLLPIVILTSSREEEDRFQGYSFGANSYIRKPVDYAQFTEVVRQLGVYWLTLNEAPPL